MAATVDGDGRSSDERSPLRGEKNNDIGHFTHLANSPHGMGGLAALQILPKQFKEK